MIINLSRLHHPVTALGPGVRAGIWVQGCTLACAGCVSRDTWDPADGSRAEVDDVVAWIAELCGAGTLDGITITGGEPAEQPEALHALTLGVQRLRRDGAFDGDVLCFTGLDDEAFQDRCPWAVPLIDAVITGAYDVARPTDARWRGSANQRLRPLTPRGADVYGPVVDIAPEQPGMQVAVADGEVWMIGIPRRGDLNRLDTVLRERGVILGDVSWRP